MLTKESIERSDNLRLIGDESMAIGALKLIEMDRDGKLWGRGFGRIPGICDGSGPKLSEIPAPQPILNATCKRCGKLFSFRQNGPHKPRIYCDDCVGR